MKVNRDKKFYFIVALNYDEIRNVLIQNDFVEFRDFANGLLFMPEINLQIPVSTSQIFKDI